MVLSDGSVGLFYVVVPGVAVRGGDRAVRGPVSTVTEALQLTHREHSLPRRRLSLPPHETKLRNRKRKFTLTSNPFFTRQPAANIALLDVGL